MTSRKLVRLVKTKAECTQISLTMNRLFAPRARFRYNLKKENWDSFKSEERWAVFTDLMKPVFSTSLCDVQGSDNNHKHGMVPFSESKW